jgi:hypothetical protein
MRGKTLKCINNPDLTRAAMSHIGDTMKSRKIKIEENKVMQVNVAG